MKLIKSESLLILVSNSGEQIAIAKVKRSCLRKDALINNMRLDAQTGDYCPLLHALFKFVLELKGYRVSTVFHRFS